MDRRGDDGSVYVLEAIILSLILLGAAYSVTTLRSASVDNERPRAHLERVAEDAMVILSGLRDANGSLLDAYLLEAYHCAMDPSPSGTSCEGRRSANLSLKVESYLPPGTGYAIALDNGVESRDIYRSVLPPGETVSASHAFVPGWNHTLLMPELSCYEAGMDANVTALPLRHAAVGSLTKLTLNASGTLVQGEEAHAAGFWNATFPAATRPSAATVRAEAEGRGGTFNGTASLSSCSLGGLGSQLVDLLRLGSLDVSPASAPLGGRVLFDADLSRLLDLPGVALVDSNVTVYEPVPGRPGEPDTLVPAAVLDEGPTLKDTWTWDVPADAFYGVHPVVARASLQVGASLVEARLLDYVTVALPDGTVPIDPPYRAVLQVWFSDWR